MIDANVFLATAIVAVTEFYKHLRDKDYVASVTIAVAAFLGLVVALADTSIGITNISVAQGLILGLGASGIAALAKKV